MSESAFPRLFVLFTGTARLYILCHISPSRSNRQLIWIVDSVFGPLTPCRWSFSARRPCVSGVRCTCPAFSAVSHGTLYNSYYTGFHPSTVRASPSFRSRRQRQLTFSSVVFPDNGKRIFPRLDFTHPRGHLPATWWRYFPRGSATREKKSDFKSGRQPELTTGREHRK